MLARIHKPLIFTTLLGTCVGGMLQAPLVTIFVGAGFLMLMSLAWHKVSYARYAGNDDVIAQSTLLLFTSLSAVIAATTSFATGMLISWAWGI